MTELYQSQYASSMKDQKMGRILLGLQGEPGSGKTHSALTFPNPVVWDLDNGLRKWVGEDIQRIPFYDYEFVCKLNGGKYVPQANGALPNRKEAVLWMLEEESHKFDREQTLILDSWTSLQEAFDAEQALHPAITKKGEIDDYDFWQKKIEYSEKIMGWLTAIKCHVIVIFHEFCLRDPKTGALIEKLQPLMQGKFLTKIKKYYPDFFRCIVKDRVEFDSEGNKKTIGSTYTWQVRSDDKFTAKTQLIIPEGIMEVEPNFSVFKQYAKPLPQT